MAESNGSEVSQPPAKKRCSADDETITLAGEKSISLKKFHLVKIINDNPQQKVIFLEGKFDDAEEKAVIILEKTSFTEDTVERIISGESTFKINIQNDIYNTLDLFPSALLNGIKTTLIYPATEKHIAKYTAQDMHLITETADDYEAITLPYLNREQFNIQWVFNILEKKTESERIVFEDSDPGTGFILLPDMKWNAKQMEDLYLIAIIHKRGIKSLRDLKQEHLPLLRNILMKGLSAIAEKYKVPAHKLRIYFHYQPSYYHLHVHFTHLKFNAPGSGVDRAHLLTDVIENIELMPDYYQKKSLSFSAKENEKLSLAFKEAGRV